MGNKVPILAVFGTSLQTEVDPEQGHTQPFYCECKWNSSPKPLSLSALEVLPVTGTKCACVKCLTPNKLPAPDSVLSGEKAVMSRSLLLLSWLRQGNKGVPSIRAI